MSSGASTKMTSQPESASTDTRHRNTFEYPITARLIDATELKDEPVSAAVRLMCSSVKQSGKKVVPWAQYGTSCPEEIRDEIKRRLSDVQKKLGYGDSGFSDARSLEEFEKLWKRPRTRSRAQELWQTKIATAADEFLSFRTESWIVRPVHLTEEEFANLPKNPEGLVPLYPPTVPIYTRVAPANSSQSKMRPQMVLIGDIDAPGMSDDWKTSWVAATNATIKSISSCDAYLHWVEDNKSDMSLVESDWRDKALTEAKTKWVDLGGPAHVVFVPKTWDEFEKDAESFHKDQQEAETLLDLMTLATIVSSSGRA
ncbi:hypothetical protein EHS25_002876 [Saitozyma podzolica]|uniref:Uncharacterized protein n=1 Tax=Saitozyma podzolica TaxID=1890683 RepID=A0A427YBW1_9TREE|nr:hypothetical protein EHS25_002876 [Saitozyma podzolica]